MNQVKNTNEEFLKKKADIDRLLLHVCCAPCLGNAIPKLKGIDVTCFFYNPNIMPVLEWQKRLDSVKKLIDAVNYGSLGDGFGRFDLVVAPQNCDDFFASISEKELSGEGSVRCTNCIKERIEKTADYAKKNGYNYFATTLTSSPQKNAELINKIGEITGGDAYIATDFKKNNGAKESKIICEQLDLYRQHYCGCGLPEKEINEQFEAILEKPFMIGNIEIPNRMVLAPMAGWSDVGFRRVAAFCGAGYTTTEMVSAKALANKSKKTLELLSTTPEEKVVAVQLFGSDPKVFEKVVALPVIQKFDIIDINMGCPMPKIVKNGDGSALMDNPQVASEIIKTIKASSKKPLTVKFRKGGKNENAVEFAKMCEEAGADAIIVHGRTRAELYSGNNDFDLIKSVVENVSIPVILSGDITSRKQAAWALYYTGASAVMVGRATVGNASIFGKKIKDEDAIRMQLETDNDFLGEKRTIIECKKHIAAYFKGEEGAGKIRVEILKTNKISEMLSIIENKGKNI